MSGQFERGFFVREPAWHKQGNLITKTPGSWAEARKAGGIDGFEIAEGPVYEYLGRDIKDLPVYDPAAAILTPQVKRQIAQAVRVNDIEQALSLLGATRMETTKRTLRTDSGKTLGTPGTDYEIIGFDKVGDIIAALTGALSKKRGRAKSPIVYDTMCLLEGGKSLVVVLYLDEPVQLPGDRSEVYPYLVLSTRNDGTGAARAMITTVRVVCANTRALAESQSDANGTTFSFRHTANIDERLEEAAETLLGMRKEFAEEMDFQSRLVKTRVNKAQTTEFAERFIPTPMLVTDQTPIRMKRIGETRDQFYAILESDTIEGSGVAGTAFGLMAGADELLDHYRGHVDSEGLPRNRELWMKRQLTTQREKQIVADLIRDICNIPGPPKVKVPA